MHKTLHGALLGALFGLGSAARADAVLGDFVVRNGGTSSSGGSVTFTLNGNGTIAASLRSLAGAIVGFGFDSAAFAIPESDFLPTVPDNTFGRDNLYGSHQ